MAEICFACSVFEDLRLRALPAALRAAFPVLAARLAVYGDGALTDAELRVGLLGPKRFGALAEALVAWGWLVRDSAGRLGRGEGVAEGVGCRVWGVGDAADGVDSVDCVDGVDSVDGVDGAEAVGEVVSEAGGEAVVVGVEPEPGSLEAKVGRLMARVRAGGESEASGGSDDTQARAPAPGLVRTGLGRGSLACARVSDSDSESESDSDSDSVYKNLSLSRNRTDRILSDGSDGTNRTHPEGTRTDMAGGAGAVGIDRVPRTAVFDALRAEGCPADVLVETARRVGGANLWKTNYVRKVAANLVRERVRGDGVKGAG